jgi:hypothetical protein
MIVHWPTWSETAVCFNALNLSVSKKAACFQVAFSFLTNLTLVLMWVFLRIEK